MQKQQLLLQQPSLLISSPAVDSGHVLETSVLTAGIPPRPRTTDEVRAHSSFGMEPEVKEWSQGGSFLRVQEGCNVPFSVWSNKSFS